MRVILQAGHYPAGGGAPGEALWTFDLAQRIKNQLMSEGIEVRVIGDFFQQPAPPALAEDAALFVALHYDGAIYGQGNNSGCFADRARDETRPQAADDFILLWERAYPRATEIPLVRARRNSNTWGYYAFRNLTAETPGVILEHGCGSPVAVGDFPPGDDAAFLHSEQGKNSAAAADTLAILQYLGLAPFMPEPEPEGGNEETVQLRAALDECNAIKAEFEAWLRAHEGRRVWVRKRLTEELIAKARGGGS